MLKLQVVRVEDDTIYVRTIRGIEPCEKHGEVNSDYILCKSENNRLKMVV